jgi:hypothetical protein
MGGRKNARSISLWSNASRCSSVVIERNSRRSVGKLARSEVRVLGKSLISAAGPKPSTSVLSPARAACLALAMARRACARVKRASSRRRAGRSKLHAPLSANEKRHADLPLQILDLLAKRGLGGVQALRRAGEVQLLRHSDEIAQMSQFHATS